MDKVKVPVGFAVGGAEDIASAQAHQDFELLAPGIPGYVASHAMGDHVTVSTDPAILAEVAEIGVNWIDYAVSGNETTQRTSWQTRVVPARPTSGRCATSTSSSATGGCDAWFVTWWSAS